MMTKQSQIIQIREEKCVRNLLTDKCVYDNWKILINSYLKKTHAFWHFSFKFTCAHFQFQENQQFSMSFTTGLCVLQESSSSSEWKISIAEDYTGVIEPIRDLLNIKITQKLQLPDYK